MRCLSVTRAVQAATIATRSPAPSSRPDEPLSRAELDILSSRLDGRTPFKLGAIYPDTVQDDRDLACDGHARLFRSDPLGKAHTSGFERRPAGDPPDQHRCRLEQIGPRQAIAELRYATRPVHLPGLMSPGSQAKVGPNISRSSEVVRIIDRADKCQRREAANTGNGHHATRRFVMPRHCQQRAIVGADLQCHHAGHFQQWPTH